MSHASPWPLDLTGTVVPSTAPKDRIKWPILPFLTPHLLLRPSHPPFSSQESQIMPRGCKRRQTNVSTDGRIPRPANCFMIFRANWLRNSTVSSAPGSRGRQKQKDVSQEAAAAWNNLSPTLKQLYKIQADIVKDEHSKKYPGWVYQPRVAKRKNRVADDMPLDSSSAKRVVRGSTAAPYQKPSTAAKGKREAAANPLTRTTAPTELVWDGSWFSGSSSMKDPFYSAPLRSLAPVSVLSITHDVKVAHFTDQPSTAPSSVVPTHPHPFLSPAQMYDFGVAQNFHAAPPVYHPTPGSGNDGLHNPERHGHNTLIPASNMLGPSDLHQLPHATAVAKPPVNPDPRIDPSDSTGDSATTTSSSVGEVPTPESEAEPPTQALVGSSGLTYDKLMDSYFHSNGWEVNPVFNPDFDSFSMMGL